jgi:hypothetical protein
LSDLAESYQSCRRMQLNTDQLLALRVLEWVIFPFTVHENA